MILLNDPWRESVRIQKRERLLRELRWLSWGLAWMTAGIILGRLIL